MCLFACGRKVFFQGRVPLDGGLGFAHCSSMGGFGVQKDDPTPHLKNDFSKMPTPYFFFASHPVFFTPLNLPKPPKT